MNFDYGIADTPLNTAVKKRLEERTSEPDEKLPPNRTQRRAMERAQRAAQRRGQRAYDREQARKAAEIRKLKAEVAALTDEERAQLAEVIQGREARAGRDHEKVIADIKRDFDIEKLGVEYNDNERDLDYGNYSTLEEREQIIARQREISEVLDES